MDAATSLRLLVNGGESERVKDETGVGVEGNESMERYRMCEGDGTKA